MRKKSLKSTRQIFMLKRYLEQRSDKWPKDEVIRLGKEIGLSRSQVYKWLWDQRNLVRQMQKEQNLRPHSNIYLNHFGYREEKESVSSLKKKICQKYRRITLRSQSQDFVLSVPEMIEFAVKMKIPKSTPIEIQRLLRRHGCELTKLGFGRSYDFSQKKQRTPQINEFKTVNEEKYQSRK